MDERDRLERLRDEVRAARDRAAMTAWARIAGSRVEIARLTSIRRPSRTCPPSASFGPVSRSGSPSGAAAVKSLYKLPNGCSSGAVVTPGIQVEPRTASKASASGEPPEE